MVWLIPEGSPSHVSGVSALVVWIFCDGLGPGVVVCVRGDAPANARSPRVHWMVSRLVRFGFDDRVAYASADITVFFVSLFVVGCRSVGVLEVRLSDPMPLRPLGVPLEFSATGSRTVLCNVLWMALRYRASGSGVDSHRICIVGGSHIVGCPGPWPFSRLICTGSRGWQCVARAGWYVDFRTRVSSLNAVRKVYWEMISLVVAGTGSACSGYSAPGSLKSCSCYRCLALASLSLSLCAPEVRPESSRDLLVRLGVRGVA
jgi:hypothetical protein